MMKNSQACSSEIRGVFFIISFLLSSYCPVRDSVIVVAEKELGVTETFDNFSPRIYEYGLSCGFYTPVKWCACFLTWVFKQLGLPVPNLPARAASWTETNRVPTWREVMPGDVASIWNHNEGRVTHAFLITATDADHVYTIEGNTRPYANHGGKDRVMRKLRPWSTVYRFSNQIGDVYHTVRAGDNLYRISLRYGVTVDELRALNGIRESFIRVGDVLTVECK